jgi:RNA polymerase sigma factor (sigma-70 family)
MDRFEFMRACAGGQREFARAFRTVVDDHAKGLFAHARFVLRDPVAAQDMVQDTLLKAWQRCHQFRGQSELFTWLRRILSNHMLDRLAAAPPPAQPWVDDEGHVVPEVESALGSQALPANPESLAAEAERMQVFEAGFERFSGAHPVEAAVLRLVVTDEMAMDDLARHLGKSLGATREYVSQCRKKARPFLAEWFRMCAQQG